MGKLELRNQRRSLRYMPLKTDGRDEHGNIKKSLDNETIHSVKVKEIRRSMAANKKAERKARKATKRRTRFAEEKAGKEVVREVPHTLDSLRELDETVLPENDEELANQEAMDEFAPYFREEVTPKIMITTSEKPHKSVFPLINELNLAFPNSYYYKRGSFNISDICMFATNRQFTCILVLGTSKSGVTSLHVCHLPIGPTLFYNLTSLKLGSDIKEGASVNYGDFPELVLNNFHTVLGRRMRRSLTTLAPQQPHYDGRRTIVFHNQRDYIFFRHYRYQFADKLSRCELQEIGPRFTLKLRYLQAGVFAGHLGTYEYLWRPDTQVSRKRFFV